MKARITLYSVMFILLYLIADVFMPVTIHGVGPQYLLCGVVAVSMFEDYKVSSIFGIVVGLLASFSGGEPFGLSAFIFMFLCYFTSKLIVKSISLNITVCLGITILTLLIRDILTFLIDVIFHGSMDFFQVMYMVTLPKILLTFPVSLIVYVIVRWIRRNRRWRRIDEEY